MSYDNYVKSKLLLARDAVKKDRQSKNQSFCFPEI